MGEAGRSSDTPLTMAPPSRGDSDSEESASPLPATGVMAPPPKAEEPDEQPDAEKSAKPGSSKGKNGRLNGTSGIGSTTDTAAGKKPAAAAVSANGNSATAKPATEDDSGSDTGVPTGQGKTEGISPGQAVRQAVAATNNWFTSRGQKPSEDDAPESESPVAASPSVAARTESTPTKARLEQDSPAQTKPVVDSAPASASSASRYTSPWGTPKLTAAPPKKQQRRNRRQAHLTVARVEPWSVMKFSFVVSVIAFIVLFVAVAVLYAVLSSLGVFTSLQHLVTTVTSSKGSTGTNITGWFSASRILGYTGMLGSLNIVLITAMATIGSVIYNLISKVFGGIEITLRESE